MDHRTMGHCIYIIPNRKTYPLSIKQILVSTRYHFERSTIRAFERKYKVGINLNQEQERNIDTKGQTPLTIVQLSQILNDLFPTKESITEFIEEVSKDLAPIAMTLYVINNQTWKIMKEKPEFKEKMLPMSTIPWFYWNELDVSPTNPRAIHKDETGTCQIFVNLRNQSFSINGDGGDYCGIVERRVALKKLEGRPLFIPGGFDSRKKVINYEFKHIEVNVSLKDLSVELYPRPDSKLDYGFSESPKIFYKHGMKLFSDGANVQLKAGRYPRTKLTGEVIIYIGKSLKSFKYSYNTLLFHLWLIALKTITESSFT